MHIVQWVIIYTLPFSAAYINKTKGRDAQSIHAIAKTIGTSVRNEIALLKLCRCLRIMRVLRLRTL